MSEIEELRAEIDELRERLEVFESRTGFMSAKTMFHDGMEWINRNRDAWAYIKAYADKCISEQRRFSIQKACEELRDMNLVNVDKSELFKVNNSYAAVLTRQLVAEFVAEGKESIKQLVSMRRSKVDRYFR